MTEAAFFDGIAQYRGLDARYKGVDALTQRCADSECMQRIPAGACSTHDVRAAFRYVHPFVCLLHLAMRRPHVMQVGQSSGPAYQECTARYRQRGAVSATVAQCAHPNRTAE
jgi:hypothetical protein